MQSFYAISVYLLCGKAVEMMTYLKQEMALATTVQEVLEKMDQIFGNILSTKYLFTQFYF